MKTTPMESKTENIGSEIEAQCSQLGQLLGLDHPVSKTVLIAAIEDADYARNLMVARQSPQMLNTLLLNPPPVDTPAPQSKDVPQVTNADLLLKATKALTNWAKTGFSTVDEITLKRREDACLSCEHLGRPEKLLQKLVTGKSQERIGKRAADCVCKLCGCSISKKITLTTEVCPSLDPQNSEMTRWGEPASKV